MGRLTDDLTFCHGDKLIKLCEIHGIPPLSYKYDNILPCFCGKCKAGGYVLTGISDCIIGIGF